MLFGLLSTRAKIIVTWDSSIMFIYENACENVNNQNGDNFVQGEMNLKAPLQEV